MTHTHTLAPVTLCDWGVIVHTPKGNLLISQNREARRSLAFARTMNSPEAREYWRQSALALHRKA
jgi:hypothetical protein